MKPRTLRNSGLVGLTTMLLLLFMWVAGAQAVTFSDFVCITDNNSGDCTTGENQLRVEVTDPAGDNNVLFTFKNIGSGGSSITDIYFDDGTLLGIASITESAGVDFEQGASPGNLPGGNNADPDFVATVGFTADSEPPTQPNGVNNTPAGEFVSILFNLQAGEEFADVLAALADQSLRIGLHVQGFAGGGSESFICCEDGNGGGGGQEPVPEPSTLLLLGSGLLVLNKVTRRFTRKHD